MNSVLQPKTGAAKMLVPGDAYDRFKGLLALDDYDPDEGAAMMNEIMADDDAADPFLDSYQHYGKRSLGNTAE